MKRIISLALFCFCICGCASTQKKNNNEQLICELQRQNYILEKRQEILEAKQSEVVKNLQKILYMISELYSRK